MTHANRISSLTYNIMTLAVVIYILALSGCGGGGGQISSITSGEQTAIPAAPMLQTPTPGNAQVVLLWQPVVGAASYNVYRSLGQASPALLGSAGSVPAYRDSNLMNSQTYTYSVTAVNSIGESTPSAPVSATPQLPTPGTVSITLDPAGVEVNAGATQKFTATVTNGAGVTFSIKEGPGGGTVAPDGTYTAPDVATTSTFHVVATSTTDPTKNAMSVVVVIARATSISVSLTPMSVTMTAGITQSFAAIASDGHGVTYSVQEGAAGGTVTATGVYTAPSVTATTIFHIVAASTTDPTKTATAAVTVTPPPITAGVIISPKSISLTSGSNQQFSAIVTGSSSTAAFSVQEGAAGGTVTATGGYTAPSVTATTIFHIVASLPDGTQSTAAVAVSPIPPAPVNISPPGISLQAGSSTTFTTNNNVAVTWAITRVTDAMGNPGSVSTGGTISAGGVYMAPSPQNPVTVFITATSQADPSQTATATVVVSAATATVTIPIQ